MMSKKKKYICNKKIAARRVIIAVEFLCLNCLLGCASRDKAIVLLNEEKQQNEVAYETEQEPVEGLTASVAGSMTETSDVSSESTEVWEQEMIYVHVCGAVASPGVVELPAGSRVEAALYAAGGFGANAAADYVNLASKVEDGQQLYFPTMEEAEALLSGTGVLLPGMSTGISGSQETAQETGKININTADAALLCTLPGIGEARAQDIIAYREKQGAFKNIEDIMQVSGIKQSAFDKISDRITVQ